MRFAGDNPLPYCGTGESDHHVDSPGDCMAAAGAGEGRTGGGRRTAEWRTGGGGDLRRKMAGLAGIRVRCNGDEEYVLSRSCNSMKNYGRDSWAANAGESETYARKSRPRTLPAPKDAPDLPEARCAEPKGADLVFRIYEGFEGQCK